ncbi:MAG: type I-E CRISPR-associated protein Cas5/CasD, partial [Gammaproteobacteria bacterium]|nr:type I-E CRISPR-associated protein Cas5/CasD [Gammaproteobacteria bacterium]
SQPSKSAVMGLLAAALGVLRNEEEKLRQLTNSLGFAVRVDAPGELIRDYHTVQVPSAKKNVHYSTRQDELSASKLNTILSQRDYRVDAASMVAIWQKQGANWTLSELTEALRKPKLTLYLGRKACPLSLPLNPKIIEIDNLRGAFDAACQDEKHLLGLPNQPTTTWYWEEIGDAGMQADSTYQRHDRLLSRKRWQYANRQEFARLEQREEG